MNWFRLTLGAAAVAVATGLLLTSCGADAPAEEQRLLVLDGIEITLADVQPYVAFYDSCVPEGGRKTKVQRVLEEHLIPLRLAQRAFPAERAEQKARAEALVATAGNIHELEKQTALLDTNKVRRNMTRLQAMLPIAMFLFDPQRVGATSPPLELPSGFWVAAAYELKESPGLQLDDYVDALQVAFVTHPSGDFMQWYQQQKQALADKATFVHPDHLTAMPPWIHPPKQP
ncbi:MAG: hypothetical protein WAT39_16390 [Planctomycetota bacterium]